MLRLEFISCLFVICLFAFKTVSPSAAQDGLQLEIFPFGLPRAGITSQYHGILPHVPLGTRILGKGHRVCILPLTKAEIKFNYLPPWSDPNWCSGTHTTKDTLGYLRVMHKNLTLVNTEIQSQKAFLPPNCVRVTSLSELSQWLSHEAAISCKSCIKGL